MKTKSQFLIPRYAQCQPVLLRKGHVPHACLHSVDGPYDLYFCIICICPASMINYPQQSYLNANLAVQWCFKDRCAVLLNQLESTSTHLHQELKATSVVDEA